VNLRYSLRKADDAGVKKHPQIVMRELGITYQIATPQSIADQWWFWNCAGMPDPLPPYLTELTVAPHKAIGNGLTRPEADAIVAATEPPK
jgi:hypothetical protein